MPDDEERKFDREIRALARKDPYWLKCAECTLPSVTRAFCAGCRREIAWDEYGLVAYDRRCWHHDCLMKELMQRVEKLLGKEKRSGLDYERLAEAENALASMQEDKEE